jgi:hypothetical protein
VSKADDPLESLVAELRGQLSLSDNLAADLVKYLFKISGSAIYNATPESRLQPDLTEENAEVLAKLFVQRLAPPPSRRHDKQGIVICAGGYRYLKGAWITICLMRDFGCKLPIELWQTGPEEQDDRVPALFEPLQVIIRQPDSRSTEYYHNRLRGWQLKPFAVLNSDFSEVLLIDADNFPVQNPESLFLSDIYQATGALFWPDFSRLGADRKIWSLCGLPYIDEPEFESGQFVVDKTRCWRALTLSLYMNVNSDFYYQYLHGDKDTYHMAWRMLGQPFSMIPYPAGRGNGFTSQFSPEGKRMFQHCNLPKSTTASWPSLDFLWRDAWLRLSETFDSRWSEPQAQHTHTT